MSTPRVTYEWVLEVYDEWDDITEVHHADDLKTLLGYDLLSSKRKVCIALTRDCWVNGEHQYVYANEAGVMPSIFPETGYRVPRRYLREAEILPLQYARRDNKAEEDRA